MFRKIGIQTFVAGVVFLWFTPVSLAVYRDDVPDFTGVLIDQDTTWYKDVTYVFEKEIRIVDGAKLTIEPGTHISFKRDQGGSALLLSLFDGKIDAIGTEVDPIVFDRASDSDAYAIQFNDATAEQVSVFQYVRFLHGGDVWDVPECPDCGQSFLQKLFIKNVFAATQDGIETLRYQWGKLHVEDVVFSESIFGDVWVSESVRGDYTDEDGNFVQDPAFLYIKNSDFRGDTATPALRVMDSSCYGIPFCPRKVHFENNWYAASSGPKMVGNPAGMGKSIIGSINFNGFSATEFFPSCATNCFSNVLFLPGLEASRLYDDQSSSCVADKTDPTRAWEPSCNNDARKLYLDASGKSLDGDIHTKDGDVLDETPTGANIYRSFLEELERMKSTDHAINDWQAVAYDWRLSLDDILADGTVAERLRQLASTSKSGKVTLVAHSNGGLLAKALMNNLSESEVARLVDKIVLVAVPQVGTPAAVAGLLHGYKQNFFPVLDTPTARGLAENMPGAYQLLPTAQYFSSVDTPVATFDVASSLDWNHRYVDTVNSQGELHDFLSDTFRRVIATNSDTDTLATLNEPLLTRAENLHDTLDTWVAPAGVRVVQIAGWGVPSTLSSTDYTVEKRKLCDESLCQSNIELLDPDFKFTIDGDGTVVTPSALWMKDVERYWVNIRNYNKNNPIETAFGLLGVEHANVLEIPQLNMFLADLITDTTKPLSEYAYFSTDVPSSTDKRLQYSLHSPLILSLYDEEGRHTGVSPTGEIEEQIPGTYYKQFGDVQYIFADEGSAGHVVLDGYETGKFTFAVEEFEDDISLGKVTFQDMPTTPETKVTFDVPNDLASASHLRIDRDGDGTTDIDLPPKIGEVVTFDVTAPVTTTTLTGTQGTNDWYISDVTVALTATDEGDIEKTEYSVDGTTWHAYTAPFIVATEGTMILQYFSTDQAGNGEEIKTVTIKIDKQAPEGKIMFNPTTQKLAITGTDSLGGPVTVVMVEQKKDLVASNTKLKKIKPWFDRWLKRHKKDLPDMLATLVDQSGHTTSIGFEKTRDRKGYVFVRVRSLGYDEQEVQLTGAQAQYKWRVDRRNQYQQLASSLKAGRYGLESHYVPHKNETWIMEQSRDLEDDDRDDESERRPIQKKLPGLVVPYMQTGQGEIEIKY
ncbi:MAG: hypothetical protein KBB77_00760 [Candidatus Moranbacteria bacterium]|nr:hypothetical protein [Candidatus Moranbacteria bacterium]